MPEATSEFGGSWGDPSVSLRPPSEWALTGGRPTAVRIFCQLCHGRGDGTERFRLVGALCEVEASRADSSQGAYPPLSGDLGPGEREKALVVELVERTGSRTSLDTRDSLIESLVAALPGAGPVRKARRIPGVRSLPEPPRKYVCTAQVVLRATPAERCIDWRRVEGGGSAYLSVRCSRGHQLGASDIELVEAYVSATRLGRKWIGIGLRRAKRS